MVNGHLLQETYKLINAQRQEQYGKPGESMQRISEFWTTYLGRRVSPSDVAMMLALMKVARHAHSYKVDNLRDCLGYVAIAADVIDPSIGRNAKIPERELLVEPTVHKTKYPAPPDEGN